MAWVCEWMSKARIPTETTNFGYDLAAKMSSNATREISPKLAPYIQSRGAKRKTKVSLLAIPQGALSVEPLPELPRPQGPQYPYVIAQARANISKFGECVVLTRVGGFYELYFEQAEEIGPLLGLKVGRKRTRGKDADVPMAGFPFFQLDRFLKVLVQDLSRHIAIAEEYPNPNKEDKDHPSFGLMWDRRVTRIITPGTLIDEKFMDPYENNYLLCVWPAINPVITGNGIEDGGEVASEFDTRVPVGLAWLDLSTGDFFTQISSRGALSAELARIGPREIVIDEACRNTPEVRLLEQEKRLMTFHTSAIAPQDIDSWQSLLEPGSAGLLRYQGFENEEVAAGSTLLSYVKDKLQGLSMKLQPPIRRSKENSMLIDSVTMRALEIKTTMKDGVAGGVGTLLKTVRRTVTRSGARRLGMWLTSPETSVKIINDRLNLVEHFIQSQQLLVDIQHKLKLTHDSQRLVQKMSFGRGDADDLVALARTILATQSIVECMKASPPSKDESLTVVNNLLGRISHLMELADMIIKSIDENGLMLQHTIEDMKAAEITELARAVDKGDMTPDMIMPGEMEESIEIDEEVVVQEEEEKPKRGRKSKAKKADKTPTKPRGHRILKEVDREKTEPWIMHRAASPTLERLHKDLDDVMVEKQVMETTLLDESQVSEHLIALKWTPSLGHILHIKARALPDMTKGILSSAIPVGSSKSTHSYHLPEWTRLGSRIEMARLAIRAEEQRVLYNIRKQVILNIHALRRNAAVLDEIDIASSFAVLAKENGWKSLGDQGRSFVANDCFVGDEESIWIITGPNMAGKSTFLRQNALISILAQTGSYVPAEHAEIGIIDQIFSRVGSADDLYRQQSTFMVEMMETAHILRNATERSFVIMDEVGRGTTVEDGYAIAGGVLRYLWEVCKCRVLFATHFHGLVELAQGWQGEVEDGSGKDSRKKVGAYCTDVMEDKDGGGWSYVHKLRRGVNMKSHAIKVARVAGLPGLAVKTAEEILRQTNAEELKEGSGLRDHQNAILGGNESDSIRKQVDEVHKRIRSKIKKMAPEDTISNSQFDSERFISDGDKSQDFKQLSTDIGKLVATLKRGKTKEKPNETQNEKHNEKKFLMFGRTKSKSNKESKKPESNGGEQKLGEELEIMQEEAGDRDEMAQMFKNGLTTTLDCLKTLATVAGPTAGLAWQDYETMIDDLGTMLDGCPTFLRRCQRYIVIWAGPNLNLELALHIAENTELFVDICATAFELRSKGKRTGLFFKKLFTGKEDKIGTLWERLGKLAQNEDLAIGAAILETAATIRNMLEVKMKVDEREKLIKSRRQTIIKNLGFSHVALNREGEPIATWQEIFGNRVGDLIPEMGEWTAEVSLFEKWGNVREGQTIDNSILVLQGEANAGKTWLMTSILRRHLEAQARSGSLLNRPIIAYFFAETSRTKQTVAGDRGEDWPAQFIHTVTRSLLWQLANESEAMATAMATQIEKENLDASDAIRLWKQLFFDLDERKNSGITSFIFIDIPEDAALAPKLVPLLKAFSMAKNVRLLLTATAYMLNCWRSIKGPDNTKAYDTIAISEHNKNDIILYISHRLDEMDHFRHDAPGLETQHDENKANHRKTKLRDDVAKDLFAASRHDYSILNDTIEKIKLAKFEADIREIVILAANYKSHPEQIKNTISALEKTLTAGEIHELNEVILWVDCAKQWLSVKELEIILAMRRHLQSQIGGEAPSVWWVAPFLRKSLKQYSQIFTLTGPDDTNDFVRWSSDKTTESIPDGPSVVGKVTVQQTEIDIRKGSIETILASAADPALKVQVAERLARLLSDDAAIDALFWPTDIEISRDSWQKGEYKQILMARSQWVYSREAVDLVASWFKDESVVKGITSEVGKGFVEAVKASDEAKLHEVLLSPAAKRMAYQLFGTVKFSNRELLASGAFLYGYLLRTGQYDSQEMKDATEKMVDTAKEYMDEGSELHEILESERPGEDVARNIEKWAAVAIKDRNIPSALWRANESGMLFQFCQKGDSPLGGMNPSYERAMVAVDLDPNNWFACFVLGDHFCTEDSEAIEMLTKAKTTFESQESLESDKALSVARNGLRLRARIAWALGNRLWKTASSRPGAARSYQESLHHCYNHFYQYANVLQRYATDRNLPYVVEFLKELNATKDHWYPYLDDLKYDFLCTTEIPILDIIAKAANAGDSLIQREDAWAIVEDFFKLAAAGSQTREKLHFSILNAFGSVLSKSKVERYHNEAIGVWKRAWDLSKLASSSGRLPESDLVSLTENLAQAYFEKPGNSDIVAPLAELVGGSHKAWSRHIAACCLIRVNPDSTEARSYIRAIVEDGIALLSDDQEANDDFAYQTLSRLFTTLEDTTNMRICWAMRTRIWYQKGSLDAKRDSQKGRNIPQSSHETGDSDDDFAGASTPDYDQGTSSKVSRVRRAPIEVETRIITKEVQEISKSPSLPREYRAQSQRTFVASKKQSRKFFVRPAAKVTEETEVVSGGDADVDETPSSLFKCYKCRKEWKMDTAIWACADCRGLRGFDEKCYMTLEGRAGKTAPMIGSLHCHKGHNLLRIPKWDLEGFLEKSAEDVPDPDSLQADGTVSEWISLDEWKSQLRKNYLP
ncbi:hypothetical protein Dda_4970 [Drechslerella dactyloides]|uniref:DNA mismatch repair proteins mutS family domain-containing protein n=1 Tax=Drechslerella dactyloides TaxID=74499 RepID=A0AAD6NIE7_DREDA|nr:hypothetical protein Dda_4970 [Drechslerella dactyloides]